MVGRRTLNAVIEVRILVPQPGKVPEGLVPRGHLRDRDHRSTCEQRVVTSVSERVRYGERSDLSLFPSQFEIFPTLGGCGEYLISVGITVLFLCCFWIKLFDQE
jgi:hypothetical protein